MHPDFSDDLACRPFGTGMGGDVEMNHPASVMSKPDENEQISVAKIASHAV